MMYGIPNMKLDKTLVVERRVNIMKAEGITFMPSTEVGVDYPADKLFEEFDAVVLCTGATKPRDLTVEGRAFTGVHFAMDFLRSSTRALLDATEPEISAEGKDVIVIGGGDTGTDCVATSLRQGCRSVVQLEIMPKPALERQPDNPWPEWPKVFKVDYGQEEAAALQGEDPRRYCMMTKKFLDHATGELQAVEVSKVEWVMDEGRYVPRPVSGTEEILPSQLVLLAMGFIGPEENLLQQLQITQDGRGNIRADETNCRTNKPGIFAAGDARRGQSLVVWAINEGRAAARECDRYLMGTTCLP